MGIHDFTFYDLIRRNTVAFGNLPAWFEADDGRAVTFSEYRQRVDRLAGGLSGAGIRKGDRIGVLGKNSLEYFVLYGAAAALGAVMLPVNWRLSADEAAFNLNDGTPSLVFFDPEYLELMEGIRPQLSSVERLVSLGKETGGHPGFDSLAAEPPERIEVSTEDGFVIIHTAAVGGRPRGALLSHGNVLSASMCFNHYFHLSEKDVHLNLLPLFHVAGFFMAVASFHAGAMNVNMSRFDAVRAADLIAEKKVSLIFDFSPILSQLLEQHEKAKKEIASLRIVAGLDTAETIEKYQKLTGGTFFSMYGQTETSCLATFGAYSDRPGAAGKTLPMAEVRLVDEYDRPVPDGRVGEIAVRGPMVFKGYWNLPEDTAYTFREGWHHTGDLGRFDPDGFLWYAGRTAAKELIKPGGENVYPAEVEKVILEHPAVEKTVVFGVPDPKWKEGIKAVCRLRPGFTLEAAELIAFVGGRIAGYKKPRYVEFTNDFPLRADGSPDREEIKKRFR